MILSEVEKIVNHIMQSDEDNSRLFEQFNGKVIAIDINVIQQTFFICFIQNSIALKTVHNGQVDVTIKGTPFTLLGVLLSREEGIDNISGNMEIIGDVGLAQRFQSALGSLEIDWEEYISYWTGDTAAHKIGKLVQNIRQLVKDAKKTVAMDISEYLRYEKEILPEQSEVDDFNNTVDAVKNDAVRLGQRIERLESKLVGST